MSSRCDAKPAKTAKIDIIDSSRGFRFNNLRDELGEFVSAVDKAGVVNEFAKNERIFLVCHITLISVTPNGATQEKSLGKTSFGVERGVAQATRSPRSHGSLGGPWLTLRSYPAP